MTTFRSDYRPYPYDIPTVELYLELDASSTKVRSKFTVELKPNQPAASPLFLNGEDLQLLSLSVNGTPWPVSQYVVDDKGLTICGLPAQSTIEIECTQCPNKNTALMGLYVSGTSLFTQCEAEGFRRITYFADRPDVMSVYTVTLQADATQYPVLLSNGNLVAQKPLDSGRHECRWHDPFPKPCYLFALVAGQFDCREQKLLTRAGKQVTLQIYSDPGTFEQTAWAMQSLERALRWDEERFDLELDLDRFMVVVARDFNMGAMENKGLNIFNAAYVLADTETSTDANFQAIEAVVGHEYFHNWTGNRVTCRDWFELSLKEGLTVFRDQEFTADMLATGLDEHAARSAKAIKRIDDVSVLRAAQFPEDAGPMAHPIRPESYQEIGNFYTATVYEKGAEVIRMMHTLLGEATFQLGMREYFRRHDGQAVTCDDFVAAMQWAWQQEDSQHSLGVFKRWYNQAGTPVVEIRLSDSESPNGQQLKMSQSCELVGVEKESGLKKLPFHIPIKVGAIDPDGNPKVLSTGGQRGETVLIELTETEQSWLIEGLNSQDTLSLNRQFSAPVQIKYDYSVAQLASLAQFDADAFARWEALQSLYAYFMLERKDCHGSAVGLELLVSVCKTAFLDKSLDQGYVARLVSPPSEKYLLQQMTPMNPLRLAQVKQHTEAHLGQQLENILLKLISDLAPDPTFELGASAAGKRALRNLAISWLCQAGSVPGKAAAQAQLRQANNMTDRLGALRALVAHPEADDQVSDAVQAFFEQFKHDALVVDKWFALLATAPSTTITDVRALTKHAAFNAQNPNRLRSLVFQFCLNNPLGFHVEDGSGYDFWAEQVISTDKSNPEVASRLARALDHWSRHIEPLKSRMHDALKRIDSCHDLSPNTREIISKALTL